jgi:hypothetical protein
MIFGSVVDKLALGALIALAAAGAYAEDTAAPAGDQEALPIELPEAFFGGTPLDYWGPNLEPEDFKDRPPFLAPKGTVLVSKGKPVTSSAADPQVGKLAQITDGDKDYAKSALVELADGVQWVQVDLGAEHEIYAVIIWHYHEGKRVYFDIVAKVSNDAAFEKDVTVIYNNDHDNSAGLGVGEDKEYIESNKGRLVDAKGVKGQFVRAYSNGNTANEKNHYVEVEVWGKPTK